MMKGFSGKNRVGIRSRAIAWLLAAACVFTLCLGATGCEPNQTTPDSSTASTGTVSEPGNIDEPTSDPGEVSEPEETSGSETDPGEEDNWEDDNWDDNWEEDPGTEDPGEGDPGTEDPAEPTDPTRPAPEPTLNGLGVSVRNCGAYGDGVTDDTAAFEQAIVQATEEDTFVMVPEGTYRLTSTLVLNEVMMMGAAVENWPADQDKLPTIIIDHDDVGFHLFSAGVSGLHFTSTRHSSEPVLRVNITGVRISNCKISDVGVAIRYKDADDEPIPGGNPGRSNIENVEIENCSKLGLYVAGTYDITYVSNVHVRSDNAEFAKSGIGIHIQQNDDLRMSQCSVEDAHIGFYINDENEFKKGTLWGCLDSLSTDNVDIGMLIESGPRMKDKLMSPVSVTNSWFSARENALQTTTGRPYYTFWNTTFSSTQGNALLVNGSDILLFNSCTIESDGAGVSAVKAAGGTGVVINGCTITSKGKGVELGEGTRGAVVTGNAITAVGGDVDDRMPDSDKKVIANNS